MKKIVLMLLALCSGLVVHAIGAPQLRCLNVNASGQVTLTWIAPASTVDFNRYEIYFSADGNAFTQVGQITTAATTTFTHTGADAINNPRCYYYVTTCSTTDCQSSDTLCTLEFYLTNLGNGMAVLNWSPVHEPTLPTYAANYEIYLEYPAGTWSLISATPNLLARDTISICEANLAYRVEIADASGCKSVSRIQSDLFSDVTAPDIPQLDSISVDFQTSMIQVGWEPAYSEDVFAYIIYHSENGMWIPADTVYGIDNTTWTDPVNSSADQQSYRVAALDSCMNSSAMSESQHNIRLTSTYDVCRREAYLNWDEYEDLPMEVESYQIYFSENGGPLTWAGETDGETRTFTLPGLIPQSTYECVVRAVNYGGNVTASARKSTFLFDAEVNDDAVYIRYVSVVDNKDLEIKVSTLGTENFSRVHLYRSIGDELNFVLLGTLENDGTDTYIFLDNNNIRVDRNLYYYCASIENECDVETSQSNISHNIILKGNKDSEFRQNYLDWNKYDGWEGDVQGYQVYRKSEADHDFYNISGSVSTMGYSDDIADLRREGEKFSYFVEAVENPDSHGFTETSRSNTVEVLQKPKTYIPNAFCPRTGGHNSVFIPINSYVTMENYNMYIYTREGFEVFHTTDPFTGWNGGYNGNLMPAGCYVYKITYTYGTDGEFEAVGTVTLVR